MAVNRRKKSESLAQPEASRQVLLASQEESFPYLIREFGLEIEVHKDVFSPKHFHGWRAFTKFFPCVRGEDVLEIGCGAGMTAILLARKGARRVVAADISPAAVANTRRNAERNDVQIDVRQSDIFSALGDAERFHTIYWNLPFIWMPPDYEFSSVLERSLYDPGYALMVRFLAAARKRLYEGGRVLAGMGDFAKLDLFRSIADEHGYMATQIASMDALELYPVEFLLYELRKKIKIFYSMPFSAYTYEEIVERRKALHGQAAKAGLHLLEQFLGHEEKKSFEAHGYAPVALARKDYEHLEQAGLVIADYGRPSIGRDVETVFAKERLNLRVIAIVAEPHLRNHPFVRLYSDYIVSTTAAAFDLAKELNSLPLAADIGGLARQQKDRLSEMLADRIAKRGPAGIEALMPTELKRRWKSLLGDEFETLLDWSCRPHTKTIRVNSLKAASEQFLDFCKRHDWTAEEVPGIKGAYRLPGGRESPPRFGEFEEFAKGLFYVQDMASLLPALALNPQPGDSVLDLAAAPGSKTTQLAAMMRNQGRILAIDASPERLQSLRANVARLGAAIVEPRLGDASKPEPTWKDFDQVLLDVPCSCEGIIRYKPHKLLEWSLLEIARRQRSLERMALAGYDALKPGGAMVYSTCSLAPEENEGVLQAVLDGRPSAKIVSLDLPHGIRSRPGLIRWGQDSFDASLRNCARLYPQANDTIGFFLARVEKGS